MSLKSTKLEKKSLEKYSVKSNYYCIRIMNDLHINRKFFFTKFLSKNRDTMCLKHEILQDTVSQCGKMKKIGLTKRKFRQINSLVISLVKTLISRNFCQKSVRVENTTL